MDVLCKSAYSFARPAAACFTASATASVSRSVPGLSRWSASGKTVSPRAMEAALDAFKKVYSDVESIEQKLDMELFVGLLQKCKDVWLRAKTTLAEGAFLQHYTGCLTKEERQTKIRNEEAKRFKVEGLKGEVLPAIITFNEQALELTKVPGVEYATTTAAAAGKGTKRNAAASQQGQQQGQQGQGKGERGAQKRSRVTPLDT